MFQIYNLFSHFVDVSLLIFYILFEFDIQLAASLSLFHAAFHLLDKLSQLPIFFVFLLQLASDLPVFSLHLIDHDVTLLELVLNNLQLLWVSERVFAFDNFFQLVTKTSTLFHI